MASRPRTRSPRVPSWLRHRKLVSAEAVLLVNAARELAMRRMRPVYALPDWARVLLTMAATVGVFAGLFYLVRTAAAKGVDKTHQVVRSVPLPASLVLTHLATFGALFYLYAWVEHAHVWPWWW